MASAGLDPVEIYLQLTGQAPRYRRGGDAAVVCR
jgi:hypothetical protein